MISQHTLINGLTKGWAGDKDTLIGLYHPDCEFIDKAFDIRHYGHVGIGEVFDFSFSIMPDFHVTYGEAVIAATGGAIEWVFSGSFRGELGGRQHDGVPVRIEGVSFMSFRDGLIHKNTDYWDARSLYSQLGL